MRECHLFEAFFIVGVAPLKVLRSARYHPRNAISSRRRSNSERRGSLTFTAHARRRVRLRPETLISFPGTISANTNSDGAASRELSVVRDRTVLESAICEFCFPNGSTVVEVDDMAPAEAREYLYFTLNDTVLPQTDEDIDKADASKEGASLYCIALKTTETITIKRIIPELMDLETCVNNNQDKEIPSSVFEERLSTLAWFSSHPDQKDVTVNWSLPYCFVIVSRYPFFTWHAQFLRLFRDMCQIQSGRLALETTRENHLAALMTELNVGLHPWARKTVVPYTLTSVQRMVAAQLECHTSDPEQLNQMRCLSSVVNLVMDWYVPVLPVTVTKAARSLVALLFHATMPSQLKIRAYFASAEFDVSPSLKARASSMLDILSTNRWEPRIIKHLPQAFSCFSNDMAQLLPVWWPNDRDRCDLALLHSTDLLVPQSLHSIPVAIIAWFAFMLLQEKKVIVTSPSTFRRSAAVFSLRSFLSPHSWPHACIPILPSSMGPGFLESPVPFLASLRRVPPEDAAKLASYDTCLHIEDSSTSSSSSSHSKLNKVHKTYCSRCQVHAASKVATVCAFHACRNTVSLILEYCHTPALITSNISFFPRSQPDYDYTTPLRTASSNLSQIAEQSTAVTQQESSLELMTPPTLNLPTSRINLDDLFLQPCTPHKQTAPIYPKCQSCCEVAKTSSLKKQKWCVKLSDWDGCILTIDSESTNDGSIVQLPETVIDHLSIDHSRIFREGKKNGKSKPTSFCVESGDSTMTPWFSIVEAQKMAIETNPTYRDDWHFILNHHLDYLRRFLPPHSQLPKTLTQKWHYDAVKKLQVKPLLPIKGNQYTTSIPAFLHGPVTLMSHIQSRMNHLSGLVDIRISGLKQMLYVWHHFGIAVDLLTEERGDTRDTLLYSESTHSSGGGGGVVGFRHSYKKLSQLKEDEIQENMTRLEELKAEMQSVASAAILAVWQTNVTWPIKIVIKLYSKWITNPSLYSSKFLWSKQDLFYLFSPRQKKDQLLSSITDDEDSLVIELDSRAHTLPPNLSVEEGGENIGEASPFDTTSASVGTYPRSPVSPWKDLDLHNKFLRYRSSACCPDAETAAVLDCANVQLQMWKCGPNGMRDYRLFGDQNSLSSSTSSVFSFSDRLTPTPHDSPPSRHENGSREDWQFFIHNLFHRVLFEEFVYSSEHHHHHHGGKDSKIINSALSVAPLQTQECTCCCESVIRDPDLMEDLRIMATHLGQVTECWMRELLASSASTPTAGSGLIGLFSSRKKRTSMGSFTTRHRNDDESTKMKKKILLGITDATRALARDDPNVVKEPHSKNVDDEVQDFLSSLSAVVNHCNSKIQSADSVSFESPEVKRIAARMFFDWNDSFYTTCLGCTEVWNSCDEDYFIPALSRWAGISQRLTQWKCFMSNLWQSPLTNL